MFKEKFKQVQFSLLELLSIISFLGLCYCLFYKYHFYNTLGIPWFITNLSPQYVFFASLKLIIFATILLSIGYFIGFFFSKYAYKVVRVGSAPLILVSIFAYFILFLIFQNSLPEYIFSIKSSDLLVSYLFANTGVFLGAFYQQFTVNEDIVNENILLYRGSIQMQFIKYKKEVIYVSSFF